MTIVAATNNKGKIKELKQILGNRANVLSSQEAGIVSEPEETGKSFTENAFIKADCFLEQLLKMPEYKDMEELIVVADDSGLCVDILDGKPGIYSARYGGEGLDDSGRVRKLLEDMKNTAPKDRGAKFVCAAVAVCNDGRRFSEIGEVSGVIIHKPDGENGFGYDPVFFHEGYGRTFAQLSGSEKNAVSHRGRAFGKLVKNFKKLKCFNVVLVEPEIPQNTGTIARTCAATGAKLHLVRPFGFEITDKNLKRAGLDYWSSVEIYYYDSFEEVKEKNPDGIFYYSTTKAINTYADAEYSDNAFLVFGKETKGLPEELLLENKAYCIRIPMRESIRSLNLSNAVNIVLYEAYRQYGFEGLCEEGKLTKYNWRDSK